jgi:hypothetical protein
MRRLTLAAVTAAHLLAIVWIDQTLRTRKSGPRREPPPLIVFFLNAREKEKPPEPLPQIPRAPRTTSEQPKALEVPPPENIPAEKPSTAITDWAEAARSTARDFAARERAKSELRSFDHKFKEPEEEEKPGIFGSEKRNHRAGLVEQGEGNSERHWISDNCYMDFTRDPPPPPNQPGARTNPVKCKPPPTGGGDHMFDALKPEYLKRLPKLKTANGPP